MPLRTIWFSVALVGLTACGGTEPGELPAIGADITFRGRLPLGQDTFANEIFVVNADGSGLTKVTDDADTDVDPQWSADGRRIYFVSGTTDRAGLYSMDPDGSRRELLLDGVQLESERLAVSPDGTRLALPGREAGPLGIVHQYDLYVMDLDGSARRRILALPVSDLCEATGYGTFCTDITAAAWSRDGQRIAYTTRQVWHPAQIFRYIGIVNADGSAPVVLTPERGVATDPAWAPDGRQIAFASGDNILPVTPMSLEVMNVDGTGRHVLVDGRADATANVSPTWSPDGRTIVFSRFPKDRPEESALYAVNIDGTELRRVAGVAGGAFDPDWNPVPQ